ncbi:class I SAM-dependent methyltransferase [Belnapia sp. T18]|uniref:Class I SAM-dependent methyltransferase n=1 Tax=Belnapia arida TaxID=2804533 RepID=A0ABS1UD25_9PROT|nr:class I SAM-dependent methyltransferase [Belnapia arida]MBL6082573.1 class I SAM-dependent methyltransferase [Belnapia arida]
MAGYISPEVALSRLLLGHVTPDGIAALLVQRRPEPPTQPWQALVALLETQQSELARLSAAVVRAGSNHARLATNPLTGAAEIASFFDRAVAESPEASVALYSLGDPAILTAATEEILAWLETRGLLRDSADVLDLGCGIGRLAVALAPRVRSVLGLDISEGMLAQARSRCAPWPHVRLARTAGQDLDGLAAGSLDLILAVDSFPYIVRLGPEVVTRHVVGAVRALRPGAALVVLNLSYQGDTAADIATAHGWATAHDLALEVMGEQPFALWDGRAFVLRRSG